MMAEVQTKDSNPVTTRERTLIITQIVGRTLAVVFTLTAACLMFTNKQAITVLGLSFDAKYSYTPAFQFLAYANVAACVLCLVSLVYFCFISRDGSFFFLFLHDLAMMALLMAASAAATAIGDVGLNGNNHAFWMPICDRFGKFCNRSTASIAFSYLAVAIFLVLTVLSAEFRAQSRPISTSSSSSLSV